MLVRRNNLRILQKWLKSFRERIGGAIENRAAKFEKPGRILRRWEKRRNYKRGYSVTLYGEWFEFIASRRADRHWLLDFNQSEVVVAHSFDTESSREFTEGSPG